MSGSVLKSESQYPFDIFGFTFPVDCDITTQAQYWFDRGLFQCFNFNHYEGVVCFELAIQQDPECAMAHWGVAYALGVNYNKAAFLSEEEATKARQASCKAVRLAQTKHNEHENQLCSAMATRFEDIPFKDLNSDMYAKLNANFVRAMKVVYEDAVSGYNVALPDKGSYPFHITASFLYAEGLMQTKPWGLWLGTMEETLIAKSILEKSLESHPTHPVLCHLYVHLMEMSPEPQAAIPQSDVLRATWKDFGHLLHMASHIDMLVGRYGDGVESNRLGIEADVKFTEFRGVDHSTYYQGYLTHNYHMKVWGCMYTGQYTLALEGAHIIEKETPQALLDAYMPFMEPYTSTKWHVFIRFGKWHDILAESLPEDHNYMVCRSSGLYAKGLAHAALGDVVQAEAVQTEFLESLKVEGMDARQMHNVKSIDAFAVGVQMLEGEILFRKWALNPEKVACAELLHQSLNCLRKAVYLDDHLPYDEPWGWMVPARHALTALLVDAHDLGYSSSKQLLSEAEREYRRDLKMHPKNVWSLRGLENCLKRFDDAKVYGAEIAFLHAAANKAGEHADVFIGASCLCALEQQKSFKLEAAQADLPPCCTKRPRVE